MRLKENWGRKQKSAWMWGEAGMGCLTGRDIEIQRESWEGVINKKREADNVRRIHVVFGGGHIVKYQGLKVTPMLWRLLNFLVVSWACSRFVRAVGRWGQSKRMWSALLRVKSRLANEWKSRLQPRMATIPNLSEKINKKDQLKWYRDNVTGMRLDQKKKVHVQTYPLAQNLSDTRRFLLTEPCLRARLHGMQPQQLTQCPPAFRRHSSTWCTLSLSSREYYRIARSRQWFIVWWFVTMGLYVRFWPIPVLVLGANRDER